MRGELHARAGRQEPARRRKSCSGEQTHGPQHQVKPAASTKLQPGGRTDHGAYASTLISGHGSVISTLTTRGRGLTSVWSSSAGSAIAQLVFGNPRQSVPAPLAHSNARRCKASRPV